MVASLRRASIVSTALAGLAAIAFAGGALLHVRRAHGLRLRRLRRPGRRHPGDAAGPRRGGPPAGNGRHRRPPRPRGAAAGDRARDARGRGHAAVPLPGPARRARRPPLGLRRPQRPGHLPDSTMPSCSSPTWCAACGRARPTSSRCGRWCGSRRSRAGSTASCSRSPSAPTRRARRGGSPSPSLRSSRSGRSWSPTRGARRCSGSASRWPSSAPWWRWHAWSCRASWREALGRWTATRSRPPSGCGSIRSSRGRWRRRWRASWSRWPPRRSCDRCRSWRSCAGPVRRSWRRRATARSRCCA